MKPLVFSFAVAICAASSAAAAEPIVFVVRHAEKAPSTDRDPPLSDTGRHRAAALASLLRDAGISAIYASEYKRTQQTAEPLAQAVRAKVTITPAADPDALARQAKSESGNVLVVAHSDTVPKLIRALGVDTQLVLSENDYDNIFEVITGPTPRLIRLHY